jgi:hypothetical protein
LGQPASTGRDRVSSRREPRAQGPPSLATSARCCYPHGQCPQRGPISPK